MSQIIVSMFVLVIAWQMWESHRDKVTCGYCGGHRGHRQDCPYDHEQR